MLFMSLFQYFWVMKLYIGFVVILSALYLFSPLYSQTSNSGFGANVYGGFISSHHDYIQHLDAHTYGLELRYSHVYNTDGPEWARRMKLPRRGIALLWINQGNADITGHAFALIPHTEFRLLSAKKGSAYFRLGTGLAWLSKRYDSENNRKQVAIGAHINPVMQFSVLWHQRISSQLEADFGIGLSHFSNGNFNLPNLGMNIPNLHLGLSYIKGVHTKPEKPEKILNRKTGEWDIAIHGATKEEGLIRFTRYFIQGLSVKYQVHKGGISRLFAGLDVFRDNTYTFRSGKSRSLGNTLETGISGGHRLMMGALILFTEVGVYTSRPDFIKAKWYQRIGVQYLFSENIYAGVCLKTHMAQSDYVQFSLGKFLRFRK